MRGGGGNFGVATTISYRLHPVDVVTGGLLIYPLEQATDVLLHYDQYCAETPDHITTAAAFATAPDVPAFPEALRGRPIVMVALCAIGASDAVERDIAPLRALRTAGAGSGRSRRRYPALQSSLDAGSPPHARNYWKACYLDALTPDLVRALVDNFARGARRCRRYSFTRSAARWRASASWRPRSLTAEPIPRQPGRDVAAARGRRREHRLDAPLLERDQAER